MLSGPDNKEKVVQSSPADDVVDYFDYLRKRSVLAWWYRRYWLYPRLSRHLSGTVLDVGCGIGDLLSYRKGTVGTDINHRAVAWCRDKGHRAELMMPDVLPFANAEFDGVVIDNVLEHLADPRALLAEVRRVLRSGGRALIGVPGRRGYASDPDHKVFYDGAALVAVMASAGFGLEQLLALPFKSSWLDKHMRQYCVYGVFQRD